jgi:hypothetical protein
MNESDPLASLLNYDFKCFNWTEAGGMDGMGELNLPLQGYFCSVCLLLFSSDA